MRTTWTWRLGLVLCLCSAAPSAGAQETRDSAGIRIIENTKPTWTPGREWRLSDKPTIDIGGGTDSAYRFGRIAGMTRLSNGRIVVADQSAVQLKFYDASGRHLMSVSGRGQGPRWLNVSAITRLPGDSIAVDMPRMASIHAPDGEFVRSAQFGPFPEGVLQIPIVMALGRFDNGTAVVMDYPQGRRGPNGASRWIDSSSLFLVGAGGGVLRPLGRAPTVTFAVGSVGALPLDFGPDAPHASSGRAIYLGFSDQYAIRVYNADWKLERIIRRAWTPRPLTDDDLDAYVDGWMEMWSKKTGAEWEAERKEWREKPHPEFLPAYSAILATAAGEIFVREPDLSGAPGCWCLAGVPTVPGKWSVFDPGGRWLGDIAMPPWFVPFEIGADYVLGRARGADRVTHVVMYRLDKPK